MKKILAVSVISSLFLMNCAFKENVKRQTIGGTKMVIYEATEVSLFKNVKDLKPTCLNGVKKAGASRIVALNEDPYAYDAKIFTSSSQELSQSALDSTKASSTTAPTYMLRCSAIGAD